MWRLYFIMSILLLSLTACKSSKNSVTPDQIKIFEELIASRAFKIESNTAFPHLTNAMSQVLNSQLLATGNNASFISLIGNPNFLKVQGDSVFSYLPYYGERQMQIAYDGTDSAIQFKGKMEDYAIKENKDNSKTITFAAISNNENFNVTIKLFQNLTTQMILNGASRFFIRYQGTAEPLE